MIIDGHCDVLYKMYHHREWDLDSEQHLDVTASRLREVNALMQCFAIYISEHLHQAGFHTIKHYVELFHQRIISQPSFQFIRTRDDLMLAKRERKIGAMLTLEGVDALQHVANLSELYQFGVRCIGITWNYGNWAADGVLEPRQAGLTLKGFQLIEGCDELGITIDVSHLCERAFWELCEHSTKPFVATHSNVKTLCDHPRNLTDEQIEAIIRQDGIIGITFVPDFLNTKGEATIFDVIRHVDYICSLGGENHVAFGSDFDGIDAWVQGLEHMGQYKRLRQTLLQYFTEKQVEKFLWRNWYEFFVNNLPPRLELI